jgi:hypothetical protein
MPKYKCRFSNKETPLYKSTFCEVKQKNYFHYRSIIGYVDFTASVTTKKYSS